MNSEILLEMIDCRSIKAILALPFEPNDNKIVIKSGASAGIKTYPLSQVCCVKMTTCYDWAPSMNHDSKLEEIETTSGVSFYARVPERQKFQTGFFGFSVEDDEFKFLFFSFVGTRSRKLFSQLGEILEKSGVVSSEDIQKGLAEQNRQKSLRLGEIISEKHGVSLKTIDQTIQRMLNTKKMPPRYKIGDILVAAKLVTQEQVEHTLAIQKNNKKKPLGELLIEQKLVNEEQILVALSTKFRMKYLNLKDIIPTNEALDAISPEIVKQLQILPIEDKGDRLVVATPPH